MRISPYNADYPHFVERLNDASIRLHSELAVSGPKLPDQFCYQPDAWFGAIALGGDLLREDDTVALADRPIPMDEITHNRSLVRRTLMRIINATIVPCSEASLPGSFVFNGPHTTRADSCSSAENLFKQTYKNMYRPSNEPAPAHRWGNGWDIITDNQCAIGLQKREGVRTTLSFVPYVIHGIPYPPGSIFRTNVSDIRPRSDDEVSVIPAGRITAMSFIRLSLFALTTRQRLAAVNDTGSRDVVKRELPTLRAMRHAAELYVHTMRQPATG